MSFPSAIPRLKAGDTPEVALLHAMERDTRRGFTAIITLAEAVREGLDDPLGHVKKRLGNDGTSALRAERRGDGVVIDFDPFSKVGLEIARLLGTDAARPLMEERAGMPLGFANCCKIIASPKKQDVRFSITEQIEWQHSIDC